MGSAIEQMTGLKSGKKKTHRGHRGGKSHGPPAEHPNKTGNPQIPPALAALVMQAHGGQPGALPSVADAGPMGGPPMAGGGADPAVAHLIAALGALHGQQMAQAGPPQGAAPPPAMG